MDRYLPLPVLPLLAILRGLAPEEARAVGAILLEEGFGILEVPLNRPGALESIAVLAREFGDRALVGAGTVLDVPGVEASARAGARLIVSPNADVAVIRAAVAAGLWSLPGAATPSEAFAALAAGAHGIKAFPAEAIGPKVVAAWKTVLPRGLPLLPVGGISPESLVAYMRAGADGFGIGGALYAPGRGLEELRERARAFREAWEEALRAGSSPAGRA